MQSLHGSQARQKPDDAEINVDVILGPIPCQTLGDVALSHITTTGIVIADVERDQWPSISVATSWRHVALV